MIGAIIQARTTSTRFPKKVLQKLPFDTDLTVLDQVVRRTQKSKKVEKIILATTTNKEDDILIDIAKDHEIDYFRGSESNVLSRYYKSAEKMGLETVVRLTSDCPCIDWKIIDGMIDFYQKNDYDYVSNTISRSFPHGLDVEVFSFNALKISFLEAKKDEFKEHVTPYIYLSKKFKIGQKKAAQNLKFPDLRITLDKREDYALLCAIFDYLYPKNNFFSSQDIVKLFQLKPWLKLINQEVRQKRIYNSLEEEINEAINILELQDLKRASIILKKGYCKE